jgi:hypothetical protein
VTITLDPGSGTYSGLTARPKAGINLVINGSGGRPPSSVIPRR